MSTSSPSAAAAAVSAAGGAYVGQYKDGKYHGFGTYTFADATSYNGATYVGQYKGNWEKNHLWTSGGPLWGAFNTPKKSCNTQAEC